MQLVEANSSIEATDSAQHAAKDLLRVIQDLGDKHSNPVLEVLESRSTLMQQHKYFAHETEFTGRVLRAFYHCHPSPDHNADEHGHFHIFIRAPSADALEWTHLAGVSMNNFGQPLRWFAVNRWVTAGPWLAANVLQTQLNRLPKATLSMDLTERWLIAMIRFYQAALHELLQERDRVLMDYQARAPSSHTLEDRDIYLLAENRIDLVLDLQQAAVMYAT